MREKQRGQSPNIDQAAKPSQRPGQSRGDASAARRGANAQLPVRILLPGCNFTPWWSTGGCSSAPLVLQTRAVFLRGLRGARGGLWAGQRLAAPSQPQRPCLPPGPGAWSFCPAPDRGSPVAAPRGGQGSRSRAGARRGVKARCLPLGAVVLRKAAVTAWLKWWHLPAPRAWVPLQRVPRGHRARGHPGSRRMEISFLQAARLSPEI